MNPNPKPLLLFSLSLLLSLLLHSTTTAVAQSAPAPTPTGPTNITGILDKAGQFKTMIQLLGTTQVGDQINTQLNNSNQGMTIFAPTDNAFSGLKPGTLNSLTDQQKVSLIQFHIIPNYLATTQFQTASNPLRTQAGNSNPGQFPLNITTAGNQVNISTGIVDTTVSNTIYTDNQLAVYQVDKVLLPLSIFAPSAPAPAPGPGKKKSPAADSPTGSGSTTSADASAGVAVGVYMHGMVGSIGVAVVALFVL